MSKHKTADKVLFVAEVIVMVAVLSFLVYAGVGLLLARFPVH